MKNSETNTVTNSSSEIRNSKFEIRWGRLYALVIAELAMTILVFYAFTKVFA